MNGMILKPDFAYNEKGWKKIDLSGEVIMEKELLGKLLVDSLKKHNFKKIFVFLSNSLIFSFNLSIFADKYFTKKRCRKHEKR